MPEAARIQKMKWNIMRSTRRVMQPFKLCILNVFCEPANWFIFLVKLYTNVKIVRYQVEWARFGIIMESS